MRKINWGNVLFYILLAVMIFVIIQGELLLNDIRKWNKENLGVRYEYKNETICK